MVVSEFQCWCRARVRQGGAWVVVLGGAMAMMGGCEGEEKEPEVWGRTQVVCEEGLGAYEVILDGKMAVLGPSANELRVVGDRLWVLESGSNTISRLDLLSEEFSPFFVDVGNDRNPYGMSVEQGSREVWIANYASHTVSVASMEDGEILGEWEDESFSNPSAVALWGEYAFVGNVNYRGPALGFGAGSVSVVERASGEVVDVWATAYTNPHYVEVLELEGAPWLVVMTNGSFDLGGGSVSLEDAGGIEFWPLEALGEEGAGLEEAKAGHEFYTLRQEDGEESIGAAGRPHLSGDGERIYASSATAPVVFVFDVGARRWAHDAFNPIWLYEGEGDLTHHSAMSSAGLLGVTAFNEDGLLLMDTTCDALMAEMIDLGVAGNMLQGAHSIAFYERGETIEVYVILGLANALWRVRLVPVDG